MIFKSRSTSPLMKAVRETFDKFDMGRQAELRIFCGEEKNLEEKFKEVNTKGEKINEEAFLPVARSLLLTSSPLLRFSFLTIIFSPMTVFTAPPRPDVLDNLHQVSPLLLPRLKHHLPAGRLPHQGRSNHSNNTQ